MTNVSGQRLTLEIVAEDGRTTVETLEEGEVVYGLNDKARNLLRYYECVGLIRLELSCGEDDVECGWRETGF